MEEDDKPFECPYCDMRFVSEDRLSVHKERHNFSLNLNTSTPKISLLSNDISDQTPTPTRFIKNCDEVGLFSDLPNPFDEQFRRASQSNNDVLINASQSSESLNTPFIPIFTSENLAKQNSNKILDKIPVPEVDSDTNPFPIISLSTTKITATSSVATSVIATKSVTPKTLTVTVPLKNENSGQTSVITSVGIKQKSLGKPTAVVVKPTNNSTTTIATLKRVLTKPTQIAPSVIIPEPVEGLAPTSQGSVLQLILKLPDGQSMPFNIPVVPANTITQNVVAVAAPSAGTSSLTAPSPAKIKLKDTIEQQISHKTNMTGQTFGGSIINHKNITTNLSYATALPVLPNTCGVTNQNVATVVPTVRTINCNEAIGGKRNKEEVEDEAEKRRKFLERNRAAATRCRKKRKREYDEMKNKVTELIKINEQLQGMVAMLRKEVAQLKTLLLAHKDCPVTQQQKSTGQADLFSLTSLNADIQQTSFLNPTFQTISGLTSNDGGGMKVELLHDDNTSQLSSSNMDSLMGAESSDDSGPFLPSQGD